MVRAKPFCYIIAEQANVSTVGPFRLPDLFRVACTSVIQHTLNWPKRLLYLGAHLLRRNTTMAYSDLSSDDSGMRPQRRSELPALGISSDSDAQGCFPRDLPSYYHFNSSTNVSSPEPRSRRDSLFFGWRYALGSCMVCSREFEARN